MINVYKTWFKKCSCLDLKYLGQKHKYVVKTLQGKYYINKNMQPLRLSIKECFVKHKNI